MKKGFTLIELLVVIVIIGILVAIALPNFIKIKDKAKEAEVKQNLHSIQLAIERYGTDADGNYPFFLYGGSSLFNLGSVQGVPGSPYGGFLWSNPVKHPFDMFFLTTDTWDYQDTSWGDMLSQDPTKLKAGFGDTLEFEGYLPKYPGNPFQQGTRANRTFGIDALQWNLPYFGCFGSDTGDKMWNLGFYGELPMLSIFTSDQSIEGLIKNELAGNFYYHPRWGDGVTNKGHLVTQAQFNSQSTIHVNDNTPLDNDFNSVKPDVSSLDVNGYDLIAVGSPRTKGQDLDNSVKNTDNSHQWRTGYLTLGQERNPWVQAGDFNGVVTQDYEERPFSDSVPDFFIIHLGSGMDKKITDPTSSE